MKDDRLVEMRVFRAVVQAGGFTAAAHVLGISQSFVSQTIGNLERRLGIKLLHRSTRMRRLTDEGERFLAACSRILDEIDQAELQVSEGRSQPMGDLRVSVPIAFGMDQIVPRLPGFLERYPGVRLHFSLSDAFANLIVENLDVVIRMGRLQDSSLVGRKLCNLQRIVVAAPSYIAAHGIPARPEDLAGHNCLMWQSPRDHLNRWQFREGDRAHEIVANGNFRSSNGLTLFQLCMAGVGILRLAEHMALPAIRRKALVPLLSDYQALDDTAIHAVCLPERQRMPRVRAFVDYFAEAFRTPPWL